MCKRGLKRGFWVSAHTPEPEAGGRAALLWLSLSFNAVSEGWSRLFSSPCPGSEGRRVRRKGGSHFSYLSRWMWSSRMSETSTPFLLHFCPSLHNYFVSGVCSQRLFHFYEHFLNIYGVRAVVENLEKSLDLKRNGYFRPGRSWKCCYVHSRSLI